MACEWCNLKMFLQDAQTGRPARPQRVKGRGVPGGYVEGLNDARTKLADCFSIPLEVGEPVVEVQHIYGQASAEGWAVILLVDEVVPGLNRNG